MDVGYQNKKLNPIRCLWYGRTKTTRYEVLILINFIVHYSLIVNVMSAKRFKSE